MKETMRIEIDMPEMQLEVWELRVTCGATSLIVARSYSDPGAWVIKTSPSSLDRQTTYKSIEQARDEAVKSVLFRERKRLYDRALTLSMSF